jgi:hypothetical protein
MSDIKDIKDLSARLKAILDAQDKGEKPPAWATKTRRERDKKEEEIKDAGKRKRGRKEGGTLKKKKSDKNWFFRGYRGHIKSKKMLDDLEKEGY